MPTHSSPTDGSWRRSSPPARSPSIRSDADMADGATGVRELATALAALERDAPAASGVDARAEAAALAAAVCRTSPGAQAAWSVGLGLPATEFARAAGVGAEYANGPTPVLAALADAAERARYARDLAAVAMAAASLGELTVSALATATIVGNAQLVAAGGIASADVVAPIAADPSAAAAGAAPVAVTDARATAPPPRT